MAKPRQVKHPMVLVQWEDAFHCSGSPESVTEINEREKPCLRDSVGWLVVRNKQHVIIGMSKDLTSDNVLVFQDRLTIPAGMVRKVKVLR